MIVQQGYQWGTVGAGVGTTVVSNKSANLIGVIISGSYVGTMTFHDAASATGTSSTTGIISFGNPTTTDIRYISINAKCRNGLLYQATGTPVMTYLWDGL